MNRVLPTILAIVAGFLVVIPPAAVGGAATNPDDRGSVSSSPPVPIEFTTPTADATVPAGTRVTVRGMANYPLDSDVSAVQVSTDGGATWDAATDRHYWSYEWTVPATPGAVELRARTLDANGVPRATVIRSTVIQQPQPCPCSVFGTSPPSNASVTPDAAAVELGMRFTTSVNAMVTGVRFYKDSADTGSHTGSLWTEAGQLLATGTFIGESASGWQELILAAPVQIRSDSTYVVSYTTSSGRYSYSSYYFSSYATVGVAPVNARTYLSGSGNGVFLYGSGFPSSSYHDTNYWVDVVVTTDGADVTAPAITHRSPAPGAAGVPTGTSIIARFDETIANSPTVRLFGPGGPMGPVTRIDFDLRTISWASRPDQPLAPNTTYTASVTVSDIHGNVMPTVTWQFTTGAAEACPCTLWNDVYRPISEDAGAPVELGLRWQPDAAGQVTGVRFYKPLGDPGTHTGTLWSAAGAALATGTFAGETATGWQTLTFATPVPVAAATRYVVSFHSSAGHYGYTPSYFASEDWVRGPLTALATSGGAPNGVYRYGDGGVAPTGDGHGTYYGVDVVFIR